MSNFFRNRKLKKLAEPVLKTAKKLLKKHGSKLTPEALAEITTAKEALEKSLFEKNFDQVEAQTDTLDNLLDRYLGSVRKSAARESFESIVIAIAAALFIRAFFIEAFTIPSGSMIPTLAVGDFLFVNKLSYGLRLPFTNYMAANWSDPQRGDVVVFVYPCEPSVDYIKRVIGVPGDEIRADEYGYVEVNGIPVQETSNGVFTKYSEFSGNDAQPQICKSNTFSEYTVSLPPTNFEILRCSDVQPLEKTPTHARKWQVEPFNICPPRALPNGQIHWKIPEGHVFVMGDNRQNSQDSRYWGLVPYGMIKGKAMFRWLSWDSAAPWSEFWNKIRWKRIFTGIHPGQE